MTTATIKRQVKAELASSDVASAKKLLRKLKVKLADFRAMFKLTKAGVLSKRDQWAEPLMGKAKVASKAKAEPRKKPAEFNPTSLGKLERQIYDVLMTKLEDMPNVEPASVAKIARNWVKDNPKLGISRFGIQMMVGVKNNVTGKVRSFYYQAPMKTSSYIDAYNWAVEILIPKLVEETPAKKLKLLADGETVASGAFSFDFKILSCDVKNKELNWWAE